MRGERPYVQAMLPGLNLCGREHMQGCVCVHKQCNDGTLHNLRARVKMRASPGHAWLRSV
jgi:hypothetical protein